ncbi:hypothetical protein QE152_g34872 [Popillia japonica]|uniref:Uncharacterized protein n=1 Tax=Popillia japonica TaxID=7064 RepID=A0AAW1ITG4_POPJA
MASTLRCSTSVHTVFHIEPFDTNTQWGRWIDRLEDVFHIEPFDTNTQWGRWIDRLEDAFEIFNITEERRVFYLLHYMGNEAYNIVCDKLAPVQPRTKSYDELVDVMKKHFRCNEETFQP